MNSAPAIPVTATTLVGDATTTIIPPIAPTRTPSAAELQLRLALRVARIHHTMSIAQLVGIYPA